MYTYLVRRQCGQIKKHYEKGEVSPMNNLKEQKLNNKGFSLVELIIVIAIMAVLIGVLAPQYLKYVERSRQSADIDNLDQIISAVEIYAADPVDGAAVSGEITCTDGKITVSGTVGNKGDVADALDKAGVSVPASTVQFMKSAAYQSWKIEFSATGVTITDNNSDNDATTNLKTALGR